MYMCVVFCCPLPRLTAAAGAATASASHWPGGPWGPLDASEQSQNEARGAVRRATKGGRIRRGRGKASDQPAAGGPRAARPGWRVVSLGLYNIFRAGHVNTVMRAPALLTTEVPSTALAGAHVNRLALQTRPLVGWTSMPGGVGCQIGGVCHARARVSA